MKNLRAKTVLVTGASSGIGKAFAFQFAALGAHPILVARSENKLDKIANTIREKYKVDCFPVVLDLSEENAAQVLFEQTGSLKMEVDVLVNNAGVGAIGKFDAYDTERYHSLLRLNIDSLTELCWLYLPAMRARNFGGIINVASTAAFLPLPYVAVYAASKSYVLHFSEALYGELLNTKVTVTCLCPSRTKSNFAKRANSPFQQDAAKSADTPENAARTGINAFLKGKQTVISGRQKFTVSVLPRFLSRSRVIKIASSQYKTTDIQPELQ